MEDSSIGRRIAFARKQRGLTQLGLSKAANVSKSLISHVETGSMPATPTLVAAVARALHVEVTELYGQPYRGTTSRTDRVHASIPAIRRMLAYSGIAPALDVPPRPLPELAAEIARLKVLQGASDHIQVGDALPAVIAELAVHAYGDGGPRAWGLLNRAYSVANSVTRRLGYEDLAQVAIERCEHAAGRADDPLLVPLVALSRALLMLSAGAFDAAAAMLSSSIGNVSPDTAEAASVLAALHLRAAITAARAGDTGSATEHHGVASDLIGRRGETPDYYDLQANAGNAAIHRAAVWVELGDYDSAVRDGGSLKLGRSVTPERHAHHMIDMSRAWLWTGRPDKALAAVLSAERIAPQMTRFHPMARETASRLVGAHRRVPEQLRGLSERMGVQAS